MNLIENPHLGLKANSDSDILMRGRLLYYHYACDGFDDIGWGCGYRALQSVLSWIQENQKSSDNSSIQENQKSSDNSSIQENQKSSDNSSVHSSSIPSILDIQKALVDLTIKTEIFIGSKEWIGSIEAAFCIDYFHKVQCRILHVRNIDHFKQRADDLVEHFKEFGSPILMGGEYDSSGKVILGISISSDDIKLLILDPHYDGPETSREKLQADGWIKWLDVESFDDNSSYNLSCPLIKAVD